MPESSLETSTWFVGCTEPVAVTITVRWPTVAGSVTYLSVLDVPLKSQKMTIRSTAATTATIHFTCDPCNQGGVAEAPLARIDLTSTRWR